MSCFVISKRTCSKDTSSWVIIEKRQYGRPGNFWYCPSRDLLAFTEWPVATASNSPATSDMLILLLHLTSYSQNIVRVNKFIPFLRGKSATHSKWGHYHVQTFSRLYWPTHFDFVKLHNTNFFRVLQSSVFTPDSVLSKTPSASSFWKEDRFSSNCMLSNMFLRLYRNKTTLLVTKHAC